jgi:hypothetical protein
MSCFKIPFDDSNIHNEYIKDIPLFNVFYNQDTKQIYICQDSSWVSHSLVRGVCTIIELFKKHYWNNYEHYLIEKIQSRRDNKKYKKYLEEYYYFLYRLYVQPNTNTESYYNMYLGVRCDVIDQDTRNIIKLYKKVLSLLVKCANKRSSFVCERLSRMFHMCPDYNLQCINESDMSF